MGTGQTTDRLRVLSLSTVFPNPAEENLGCFVRHRLAALAERASVRVVAPVAVVDYAARGWRKPGIPQVREDGGLRIYHPGWVYLPEGGYTNGFWLAARLLPFLGVLRREDPFEVIDAHFAHPEGIAAALLGAAFHCPFTITLRGNEIVHARSRGKRRWIRWALQRAARVIAVSESLRRFAIAQGAAETRVWTIPNGIDAGVFYPRPYAEARAKLGIPERCRAIVSAGYLVEGKGHHRVMRALSEIRRDRDNAELWVIGGPGRDGQFENQLHGYAREYGLGNAVHFMGSVAPATLADYMSAADVFCLASSREGWPNVVHEAQACGTPVVATAVGAVKEMIPRPELGYVVAAGDQAGLTAALRKAMETRWDRVAIAAWGGARSWRQVAEETAEALGEAAMEGKAAAKARLSCAVRPG